MALHFANVLSYTNGDKKWHGRGDELFPESISHSTDGN